MKAWEDLSPVEDFGAIERSPLHRIVAIGVGRNVGGISIELHSIELRELGGFGSLQLELQPSPSLEGDLLGAEVEMADDRNTPYKTSGLAGAVSDRRGPHDTSVGRLRFAFLPTVPTTASRMDVRIKRIYLAADPRATPTEIDGPWQFAVNLLGC